MSSTPDAASPSPDAASPSPDAASPSPDAAGPSPDTAEPPAPDGPPPLRASDTDRQATVHSLQDALARGMLTFEEAGDRMRAAWAARFVRELPPLTADLPSRAPEPGGPPGWRRVWLLLLEQLRAEVALVSAGGLRSPRSRRSLAVALLLGVTLVTLGSLAAHGLSAGDPHPFRGGFGPEGFGHR